MRAIDTNIIVRYLTGDHPEQAAKAQAVVDDGEVFVATTVMLEVEWVLRSVYGFSRGDAARGLRAFAGLANVRIESAGAAAEALDRAEAGMDFADALHLAAAAGCEAFLTFDRKFIAAARDLTEIPVVTP